ncbi:MAG: CaiB/BaiF CoA-transferase family protein [Myxococcota bacterium]|nr:CaiB/BaiF CoA-transferase family protein [Myxococcota bacterium]
MEGPQSIYRCRDQEEGALSGLRVLDLTLARAGPTCVRQLGDMGADVIRISQPNRIFELGHSDSDNLHRGKRSICIDLKKDQGRAIFLGLVEKADILVENFRPPVKDRLRIGYPDLCDLNPRLIYASLSGFGQEGPYRDRRGLDQVIQGMSGLMSVTGPKGSGPWRAGIAISDTAAGTFLAQGVLAALYARERTGKGQWLHTSLLESLVNFMDFQAVRWLVDGEVPTQSGNDHPTLFPMGTFKTKDGTINLAVTSDWVGFIESLGAPELLEDPRFQQPQDRLLHREPLRQALEARLGTRTTGEWLEIFTGADVICGPILAVDEVFEDVQARHLNLTRQVEHPQKGEESLLRHPVTFSETPTGISGAPHPVGSDTEAVLLECGYEPEEIAEWVRDGVVKGGS